FKSMGQVIVVNAICCSWRLKTFRQRSLVVKTILTDSIAFFYSQGLTFIVKLHDENKKMKKACILQDSSL
ncbi:hypothetical protein, partial [Pseudoramibacter alactolyticus]|uniref:hypothetical protein n=1 Tax=Pseudoramibacter alactolyticus TaxID=113287 RepID=UPI0028E1F987